jgi:hypothetical protein
LGVPQDAGFVFKLVVRPELVFVLYLVALQPHKQSVNKLFAQRAKIFSKQNHRLVILAFLAEK